MLTNFPDMQLKKVVILSEVGTATKKFDHMSKKADWPSC